MMRTVHFRRLAGMSLALAVLVACAGSEPVEKTASPSQPPPVESAALPPASPEAGAPSPTPTAPVAEVPVSPIPTLPTSPAAPKPSITFGYTYQQADGNRLVAGQGEMPETPPLDLPLAAEPAWVVAAPVAGGSLWVVVLADSRVQAFRVADEGVDEISINPSQLLPGMPPILKVEAGVPALLTAPVDAPSPLTHPVSLNDGRLAFVHAGGAVMIWDGAEAVSLDVNALPDARLLLDEGRRVLLLAEATSRYAHGVLGDSVEAAGIALIETMPAPRLALTISIPDPAVVEGIAPIWTDLTGDGLREIIVTLSNAEQGAQLVVFNEAGEQIAAGPAIGRGGRWRHQLAVAPFGPQGEVELVDVLTPHLGGVVEFYQLAGDSLRIVAQVPGYTSHVIGSRNLDMAVAGDFDGDNRVELLLPNQARTELGAIGRTTTGAEVAWTVPVGDVASTNLAAVTLAGGRLGVGVGRADGVLRLWLP